MKIKLRELLPIILSIIILIVSLIGLTRAAVNNNGIIGGLFNVYNSVGWDYNSRTGTTRGYRFDAKNIFPTNFGLNTLTTTGTIKGNTGIFGTGSFGDIFGNNIITDGYGDFAGLLQVGSLKVGSNLVINGSGQWVGGTIGQTPGQQGPIGLIGSQGPMGATGVVTTFNFSGGITNKPTLSCPSGTYLRGFDLQTGIVTCDSPTGGGTNNTPPIPTKKTVLNCGTGTGVLYGTLDGTDIGLTCSDDIIICNGTPGIGITISACNAGATTVYINQSYPTLSAPRTLTLNTWMGGLYQWGNNADISMAPTSNTQIGSTTNNSTYSNNSFRTGYSDWVLAQNDNLWGNGTNTNSARIGPCPTNYHVPTNAEWSSVFNTILGTTQSSFSKTNQLKIPAAGFRSLSDGGLGSQGSYGYYWSSSPSGTSVYFMYFYFITIKPSLTNARALGFSVRCFKN